MPIKSCQRGITLIEVLVALLIFSVGLIGLAGLMTMAMRANQVAYQRTQVTFLADGMAERMRANALGVWRGSYSSKEYPSPVAPIVSAWPVLRRTSPCTTSKPGAAC